MDEGERIQPMAAIIMADGETSPKEALTLADEIACRATYGDFGSDAADHDPQEEADDGGG